MYARFWEMENVDRDNWFSSFFESRVVFDVRMLVSHLEVVMLVV